MRLGKDRAAAIARLAGALDAYYIRGLNHNIPFLAALVRHPRFARGELTTNFIAEEFPKGFHGVEVGKPEARLLSAVAAFAQHCAAQREVAIEGQLPGHAAKAPDEWIVRLAGHEHRCAVTPTGEGASLSLDGTLVTLKTAWRPGEPLLRATIEDGAAHVLTVQIERAGIGWRLTHGGHRIDATVMTPRTAELAARMPIKAAPDLSRFLLSPMPGLLVSIAVSLGQEVKAGEVLAVVEAMKMENVLRAERDGVVGKLHAKPGDSLAVDQHILEFA